MARSAEICVSSAPWHCGCVKLIVRQFYNQINDEMNSSLLIQVSMSKDERKMMRTYLYDGMKINMTGRSYEQYVGRRPVLIYFCCGASCLVRRRELSRV